MRISQAPLSEATATFETVKLGLRTRSPQLAFKTQTDCVGTPSRLLEARISSAATRLAASAPVPRPASVAPARPAFASAPPMMPPAARLGFDADTIEAVRMGAGEQLPVYEEEGAWIRPLPAGTTVAVHALEFDSDSDHEIPVPSQVKTSANAYAREDVDNERASAWFNPFKLCLGARKTRR